MQHALSETTAIDPPPRNHMLRNIGIGLSLVTLFCLTKMECAQQRQPSLGTTAAPQMDSILQMQQAQTNYFAAHFHF